MRLSKISIANMAKFEAFEASIPAIALLQGKNGEGKTSFLDCIRYVFARGHDADLIHGDAPEGEILIEFDDGAAVKCRADRQRNETTRSWRAPGAKRFVVSREQIDAISEAVSYDPLAFMDKTEKEQVETLLRIITIECSPEELAAAVAGVFEPPAVTGNGLEQIEGLRRVLYERRRDINVAASSQESHAAELEKTLPPEAPQGDWNAEVIRIEEEKQRLVKVQSEQLGAIKDIFEQAKQEAAEECQKETQAAINKRDAQIEAARIGCNQAAAQVKAKDAAALAESIAALATARERARAAAQSEGTRTAILMARHNAAQKREQSTRLSAALERLDQLKATVAARLPIKGITIQDGRILREEQGKLIPFSRWNTEAKMRFCLRIAVLAHGECGFIVVDNCEHFDSEKRQALLKTAEKYAETDGLQFLMAAVSDQPLTVSAPVR